MRGAALCRSEGQAREVHAGSGRPYDVLTSTVVMMYVVPPLRAIATQRRRHVVGGCHLRSSGFVFQVALLGFYGISLKPFTPIYHRVDRRFCPRRHTMFRAPLCESWLAAQSRTAYLPDTGICSFLDPGDILPVLPLPSTTAPRKRAPSLSARRLRRYPDPDTSLLPPPSPGYSSFSYPPSFPSQGYHGQGRLPA